MTFAFSRRSTTVALLFLNVLVCAYSPGSSSNRLPFLQRADVVGVWRLTTHQSLLPTASSNEENESEIALRLNEDGSFDRYSNSGGNDEDELHAVLGRGGSWEYQDSNLILAPDRPDDANARQVHDTVLSGKVIVHASQTMSENMPLEQDNESSKNEQDLHLSIQDGQVYIGKFMYPKKHKAFFEEPMLFHKTRVGTFQLNQLLGNLNARLEKSRQEAQEEKVAKFHKSDFYGRTFYLTTTPHKINPQYAANDKHYKEEQVMHDIRVIPIKFHVNNTFSAEGANKILRGRYGIAGKERDRLWFQVSLFGAGRSAPGSVYSEGQGLTHEDRRGYRGEIQKYQQGNRTMLHVQGHVFFGNELGIRKRPFPMASFALQEIVAEADDDDDESDFDEEDEFENVFQ